MYRSLDMFAHWLTKSYGQTGRVRERICTHPSTRNRDNAKGATPKYAAECFTCSVERPLCEVIDLRRGDRSTDHCASSIVVFRTEEARRTTMATESEWPSGRGVSTMRLLQ
jgi:hypothetical protein